MGTGWEGGVWKEEGKGAKEKLNFVTRARKVELEHTDPPQLVYSTHFNQDLT